MTPQAHSAVNIEAGRRGFEKLKLVLVRVEGIAMLRLLVLLLLLLVQLLLKSIYAAEGFTIMQNTLAERVQSRTPYEANIYRMQTKTTEYHLFSAFS